MHERLSREESIAILQEIMLNHFYGWLRLPITNLVDRQDIIRFCCSRSWQASHIIKALFAINQFHKPEYYLHTRARLEALQRKPNMTYERLYQLACSSDFKNAAIIGIGLIKDILSLSDKHFPEVRPYAFLDASKPSMPCYMSIKERNSIALRMADSYKDVSGIQGIVVAGSLAKGVSDETSDIDMKAYCSVIPDIELRRMRLRTIDPKGMAIGESDRLTLNGLYIHIDFEEIENVESAFHYLPKASYSLPALLEPIQTGVILWDPKLIIRKWKEAIELMSVESKRNISLELVYKLDRDLQNLYITVENKDPIYASIIMGDIISLYFQILGILNDKFMVFPKWMHLFIEDFKLKPENLYPNFCGILTQDVREDGLRELNYYVNRLVGELLDILESVYKVKINLLQKRQAS